ncbi:MAG: hypothetical protein Q8Q95_01360 [bacterium]|nr:hypothetical protein [bacterium]
MTIKTRRILLSMAVVIFLAAGSVLLMYARGYRWDFSSNKFVLSGAIYVESVYPKETEITYNGKVYNKNGSALIKNLLPSKKYRVSVSKDSFQTWEKEFQVTPGLVTNTENIVLFPKQLQNQIVWPETSGLNDFTISVNEKNIAVKINTAKVLVRDLTNINATSTELKFPDKLKNKSVSFLENNKGWSKDSQKLIILRETAKAIKNWYIYDSSNDSFTNLTTLYEKKLVLKNPSPTPLPTKFAATKLKWFGENGIIALIDDKLILLDIKEETVTDLNFSGIENFDVFENKIIAIKNPNILLLMDSAVQNISALGETKFENPNTIYFSPEGDKAVYRDLGGKNLGVIWLKETTKGQPRKANNQEVIYVNNENTGNIDNEIYWHHFGEYVLFNEVESLKTAEIDTRSNVNIASWPENKINKTVYLPKESRLYILENSTVKVVEGKF